MGFTVNPLEAKVWPSHVEAKIKKIAIALIFSNAMKSMAFFESLCKLWEHLFKLPIHRLAVR